MGSWGDEHPRDLWVHRAGEWGRRAKDTAGRGIGDYLVRFRRRPKLFRAASSRPQRQAESRSHGERRSCRSRENSPASFEVACAQAMDRMGSGLRRSRSQSRASSLLQEAGRLTIISRRTMDDSTSADPHSQPAIGGESPSALDDDRQRQSNPRSSCRLIFPAGIFSRPVRPLSSPPNFPPHRLPQLVRPRRSSRSKAGRKR